MNGPNNSEIVIVRRGGHGGHGDHHSGVWKIAYADFMTAMMAFFLVMWLINAANEETRAQVASYFNPVKLTDSVTSDKGLNRPKNKPKKSKIDSPEQSKSEKEAEKEFEEKKGESEKKRLSEEKLFKDPYAVLAQLAGQAAQGSPAGESETGAATAPGGNAGLKDGEAYRDPFDPQSWRALPQLGKETEPAKAEPPAKDQHTEKPPEPPVAKNIEAKPSPVRKPADPVKEPADPVKEAVLVPGETPPKPEKASEPPPPEKQPPKDEPKIDAEAKALMKSIEENLGQYGSGAKPGLSVEATDEGLLISLTDTVDFGMFTIGSAEPKPKVVAIMARIAAIIKDRPGMIVLRGHTDGRPYRSELYDNWRLSSARAQMAHYMLTRAGIGEERVARIEGHADRMLKRKDDPNAAENRRIEILLKAGKP